MSALLLEQAVAEFAPRLAFAHSLGVEDAVILDMLSRASLLEKVQVFTLDTGRLHEASHAYLDTVREHYDVTIDVFTPDASALLDLARGQGQFGFRTSLQARKSCCRIRKVEPLMRALAQVDAWIVGLRRSQSPTRAGVETRQVDAGNQGIVRFAPLADFSEADVWAYVDAHRVPVHRLHREGYPSIGCAPCTRAVSGWVPGADNSDIDIRSGRWWWENPEHKECGLHWPQKDK